MDESPLVPLIRELLSTRRPLELLALASALIRAAAPDPVTRLKSPRRDPLWLDQVVTGLIDVPCRETTTLLAVLAELLIDDEDLRARCRQHVAARDDMVPAWARRLGDIDVYRAVRMPHVLGDADQLLIGARLIGGHELTCLVYIDHNLTSAATDVLFLQNSIANVLRAADHPDMGVAEMSLADARAWITQGLEHPLIGFGDDSGWLWPALLTWLIRQLPDNGTRYLPPAVDFAQSEDLLDAFFASPSGAPFNACEYRELALELLLDTGTGDPLRWSPTRVEHALAASSYGDTYMPIGTVLNVPEILRAYIPFAHARSGIRAELTAAAIAVVDRMAQSYKREVLERAADWGEDFGADAS
ncbi:hypothetical protein [Mycolicibacterium elephantis]|uniref:Uncharacterized protein n=1 Tax=Mycolicibacterium elephantis DSM 44368 TaxID=1335622 RepID=A0A439DV16_9MYCO|nr:hypothetical protein [Mycolicibacterium elephantis]MCV7220836.1 hypothetical protein [Mycolicibacterium elephantis]RWA20872.1 hypothetical protein MELE44368_02665 [Mycolicibacterium elephantis DSM 44368]